MTTSGRPSFPLEFPRPGGSVVSIDESSILALRPTAGPTPSALKGRPGAPKWSPEMVARYEELHAQGLRDANIAVVLTGEFGRLITRNAVIGRRFRLAHPTPPPDRIRRTKWTDDQFARLRSLAAADMTRREIARVMGRSYSSIKEYARHMGLRVVREWTPPEYGRPRKPYQRRTPKERRDPQRRGPHKMRDLPIEHTTTETTLLNLSLFQCHWPIRGCGADQFYCGAIVDLDTYPHSYCSAHCERAYLG